MTDKSSPRFPAWVWIALLLLYSLVIPWWAQFGSSEQVTIWFGLPAWVVLSYLASVLVALVANLVIHRYWPARDLFEVDAEVEAELEVEDA